MPDQETQFDSVYDSYFMRLFDDIFSFHEESLVPLSSICVKVELEEKKKLRTMEVERLKKVQLRRAYDDLSKIRIETEKKTLLRLAPEVFERLSTEENHGKSAEEQKMSLVNQRIAQAYAPLDIKIPPVASEQLMPQWGLGGPSSHQYKLIAHLLQLSREDARPWFFEMVASYLAFREGRNIAPRHADELNEFLKDIRLNREEERHVMNMFFPDENFEVKQEEKEEYDGPSIGKVFLEVDFLTRRNEAFKAFVRKCFTMKPEVRELLAGKYLFKRMTDLCSTFYTTKELKHNYVRIAWERKSEYMDDYTICLILFIHDKCGNIQWEEVEELIYPEAKRIIQRSSQIVGRSKKTTD